jgi:hypothetical protein
MFDGKDDPLGWLNRCEQFFRAQHTREADKVWLASFHMTGAAQQWYFMLERDTGEVSWQHFKRLCNQRFGPAVGINHLADLARLPFRGTVAEYQEMFLTKMAHAGYLTPEQQVRLFTGGLPEAIRIDVELQVPQDLQRAMALARAYEQRSHALATVNTGARQFRSLARSQPQIAQPTAAPSALSSTTSSTKPFKKLSPAELLDRRQKGLCYNCDEQYTRGHRCQKLFYLEVTDYDDETEEEHSQTAEEPPLISLHAVTGVRTDGTMQVCVQVGDKAFNALIDTGSTHNFFSPQAAQSAEIQFQQNTGARVMVANGDRVPCSGIGKDIEIKIGQDIFTINAYSIPLDGFDMILGVSFLKPLRSILMDFDDLVMAFNYNGKRVLWKGLGSERADIPSTAHLHTIRQQEDHVLDQLLHSFDDVFSEPKGLPPSRPCDHRIHLKPNTAPVAVHPYRYPQLQKNELEDQCSKMLAQGIIRPSTSPFSAPVLLVKKHDNSWRFCVDYRALNDATIKDKFPIPVVEELLDELNGAKFFTKLDLRSGYHQVRVHPEDIDKTAFRTHHGHFEFLVMPFGLSNAPSTFQALMNSVLGPFLRKFVLVFFDDILIYSHSWTEHMQHLKTILNVLLANHLHVKHSKCSFATSTVSYLGHVISDHGVAMDETKVEAVQSWPTPRSVRGLRGFLGLAGYYRRFIQNFGTIAAPLTQLLKKNSFQWNEAATASFFDLKKALTAAPVLQLPDFEQCFTVECDASGSGFGAVLHQGKGPVAFFSKQFAPRHLKVAAYERELIGLVQAVRHWRPYLWGRQFSVKTDHYALKFMLDQRLSTIPQHQWISKLFGYDFTVEYRPGRLNTVADALSRRDTEELSIHSISTPSFQLYSDINNTISSAPDLSALRNNIVAGLKDPSWTVQDGLILKSGKVYIPSNSDLLQQILQLSHTGGHEGIQKTLHRLRAHFYVDHDRRLVTEFVSACTVCQQNKTQALHPAGLLQPLPVPSRVWADISMDFIEALPKVHGKSVILTVVDRFSKFAHFIPLSHPYTASSVGKAFFSEVVRLHGLPESIVSDRDPVFTGKVWKELFIKSGVSLKMSTAFHPQTDGQSEAVNKTISMYLRCITGDRPRTWLDWLPWAEYCYNTSYHSALKTTPFQVVYGRPPPPVPPYQVGSAATETVDTMLADRSEFLAEVRTRLTQAQDYARKQYNAHHRDLEFQVGDWVWLRLLNSPTHSLVAGPHSKLSPRYAGPFQITERIGPVAYRLQLPSHARIHDVFHVGLLKPFKGTPPASTPSLPPLHNGRVLLRPERILGSSIRQGTWHVLIQWAGMPQTEATWEPVDAFRESFPSFQLEDELFVGEGRNVVYTYERRGRQTRV